MARRTPTSWALRSTVALVVVLLLCALAVFLVPAIGTPVHGAVSILKTESPQAAVLFLNLTAHRSPLGVVALAALVLVVPGFPLGGLLAAARTLFGLAVGTALVALGLLLGVSVLLGIVWVLVGQHLRRWRIARGLPARPGAVCAYLFGRKRTETAARPVLTPERRRTMLIAGGIIVVLLGGYYLIPGVRPAVRHAVAVTLGNPAGVAAYLRSFGVVGPIVSFALMVLQSVAAPLPAFVITFANGMIWGWLRGALLSWSSAMAGAALCFWLARWFGRPLVEKLAGGSTALDISDRFFVRFGNRAVLIARLLPFVSFDIISYGAGLTSMGFGEFLVATGLGQLPATLVYSYLASIGGGATSIKILLYVFVATAILLVLGVSLKPWFMRRFFPEAAAAQRAAAEADPAAAAAAQRAAADASAASASSTDE